MATEILDNAGGSWQPDEAPPVPTPGDVAQRAAQRQHDAADGDDDARLADDAKVEMYYARKLRSEAKGLRTRAHTAEAERDQLRTVVDAVRRGEVERLAAAELRDARDLLDRHQLDEFLDESGNVDPGMVSAAARALIDERPHFAVEPVVTKPPTDRPLEVLKPGGSPDRPREATTWYAALRPFVG